MFMAHRTSCILDEGEKLLDEPCCAARFRGASDIVDNFAKNRSRLSWRADGRTNFFVIKKPDFLLVPLDNKIVKVFDVGSWSFSVGSSGCSHGTRCYFGE